MKKRVLVAGMHHESNSFNPIVTKREDFNVLYGDAIVTQMKENDSLSGLIATLLDRGYEVIPVVTAYAVPNGEVDHRFYTQLREAIVKGAEVAHEEAPLDAIALSLHGSMRVKGVGEAEGPLLEELRSKFPGVPIFSSLDMHATMTVKMHQNCDGFVGYKCAPHTDCTETGAHAAQLVVETLENGVIPRSAWVKVPIVIAGEKSSTDVQPMIDLVEALRACEGQEAILAASYLMGYPWADNEDSAVGVYVVSKNDAALAEREAIRLAELIWSKREAFCFHTETYGEAEALDVAFEAVADSKLPIYLSDSGDNPTAGASSDCTGFLKRIMADPRTDALKAPVLYGGIYDPEATLQCKGRVGEVVMLTFGAAFDKTASTPITATGTVKAYLENWTRLGMLQGDLALFNSGGMDIVLAQTHVGYIVPELFSDLGVDPSTVEIVVCKLGYLTAHHKAVAGRSIMALTAGNTNEDLTTLPYCKVKRPLYPLDDDFEYSAKAHLIK